MARAFRRNPSDAELAVLKELWAKGPLTARAIAERLYPRGTASDMATVQKLLQRLEAKGLVTRERKPPAHLFRTQVTQEQLVGEQLEAMAEKLTGGSLAPFITHLINARKLTERDLEEIRRLIRENT